MRTSLLVLGLACVSSVLVPAQADAPRANPIPRFAREPNPIALTGPARPQRYMEASGLRAAFLGREDGSFEAWVYPLKVLHGFQLSFGTPAYADPIPGSELASWVDVRPEASVVRYAHDSFTADAIWLVPRDQAGGLVLLDIHTSVPLNVVVKFRIDLKPMWPAALGGQYSYWDDELKAYVAGEASRKHAALIGSPFALAPPEQPAHNLPDAPSQFTIAVTPEIAARGLVPIVIAATPEGLDAARKIYATLLAVPERAYRETAAHYRDVREKFTSLDTPDDRFDLAFEWGKVALDKGFICNPHLGCGLIAGLGPSGTTERPGFGWFFGGDAFINSWAMTAYGDFDSVKQSLEFLRKRQRADGKMMHELSQAAAYIRWFEDFPYGYYHADTTPLYITAVRDYVRASGDLAFAKDFWPSMKKAYEYCASTDEDDDGLMDNTKAGLAAVETGTLRSRDVLTDVFLAAAWTEATAAFAELGDIAGDPIARAARAAHEKARASLNERFLDDQHKRINFAFMKDGKGQAEQTVWPGFGIWRGVFDAHRPAVSGALDELAGAGIGADWGARMLSRESKLYDPLSYNNGAAWPFLTGFATLALYSQHRPAAAWTYLDGTADLTFLEPRGYMPELFSGDRLRSIDAAVPHQLFATTGFMSGAMRGLVGLREPAATDPGGAVTIEPQLPAGWDSLRISRLRWRDAVYDVNLSRREDVVQVTVKNAGHPRPILVRVPLEPGAKAKGSTELRFKGNAEETQRLRVTPGFGIVPVHDPLAIGDESVRLRVIDETFNAGTYRARLQGRRGRTYRVRLSVPGDSVTVTGGDVRGREGKWVIIDVTFDGDRDWVDHTLSVSLPSGKVKIKPGGTTPLIRK
ncbi:MAG: MGH1-like glycoside hydrolase domain-containing protein [Acidobacteriota bacterium]